MKMDHYYRYDEIVEALQGFVRAYPGLCSLSGIGKTREGRDIWCLTVCNGETGAAEEKAAFFMDGNIHSGEVASSMAVLYTLEKWLSAYGQDDGITSLLNRYTVYAIPRINADAAEIYLTTPRTLRGSTEKYYPEENGIQPCDLDGDGEIRQMRILDPAGKWKAWEKDPRVMMERQPDDVEGPFYTLVSEGVFRGGPEDFAALRDARPQEDLDPNRQFPFEWNKDYPDPSRPTSGPEPLHDQEVRALYDFVCAHPNIVFHMNFHTYGGLHISPAVFCPHLDAPDAGAMRRLGLSMRKKTGYKCEGIFPEGAKDIAPGTLNCETQPVPPEQLTILTVCGYMALFGAVNGVAATYIGRRTADALLCLLDVPSGALWISARPMARMWKPVLLAGMCGFGGACIAMQSLGALKGCGMGAGEYVGLRAVAFGSAAGWLVMLAWEVPLLVHTMRRYTRA